jgi:large subunit ribosomal protein L21
MAYAVIRTGGKQFVVEKGSTIRIPSVDAEAGKSIELDALLSSGDGGDADGGAAKVVATVVDHGRGAKIVVFKKKRRKHYKRKQGHRQGYTTITIDSIGLEDCRLTIANCRLKEVNKSEIGNRKSEMGYGTQKGSWIIS